MSLVIKICIKKSEVYQTMVIYRKSFCIYIYLRAETPKFLIIRFFIYAFSSFSYTYVYNFTMLQIF